MCVPSLLEWVMRGNTQRCLLLRGSDGASQSLVLSFERAHRPMLCAGPGSDDEQCECGWQKVNGSHEEREIEWINLKQPETESQTTDIDAAGSVLNNKHRRVGLMIRVMAIGSSNAFLKWDRSCRPLNLALQLRRKFSPKLGMGFHQTRDIAEILDAFALPAFSGVPCFDFSGEGIT